MALSAGPALWAQVLEIFFPSWINAGVIAEAWDRFFKNVYLFLRERE